MKLPIALITPIIPKAPLASYRFKENPNTIPECIHEHVNEKSDCEDNPSIIEW
jgi:hypothetical protein